ncbi:MAG: sialate O-acetylesterase, partial [Cyclobacteriaceae bacterium]
KGYWGYKVGQVRKPGPIARSINTRSQPVVYFNGMIAPFTDYAIKGVIWYQGESNTGRAEQYDELFPALIQDWRRLWNSPEMPFLFVQLTNFMDVSYLPEESNWARLRESQRKALDIPNTAMAVTIDLGEWNDIHPDRKRPVGERLALGAMKVAYGEDDVVYSGPMINSARLQDGKIVLTFDHIGGGLISKDGEPLRWFAVAGDDKKFTWAEAEIAGDTVVLTYEGDTEPVYVRYAWSDNPDPVNFYNKEGLPASPFQVEVEN